MTIFHCFNIKSIFCNLWIIFIFVRNIIEHFDINFCFVGSLYCISFSLFDYSFCFTFSLIDNFIKFFSSFINLFLAVLTDTTFPVEPRTWDIPGDGDEDNPLSFETLVIFMPGLDSSFVLELFDSFTDTSNTQDSSDIISDIFLSLTNDLYLGLQG